MELGPRERIVNAASVMLAERGIEKMSIRAVSTAAQVQIPAIYRIFGDKEGLVAAVTEQVFRGYLKAKSSLVLDDAIDDLRRGWDLHVGFGLDHPEVYAAIYGSIRGELAPAVAQSTNILHEKVTRVARAGRLIMSVHDATQLIHCAGRGVTLTLIGQPLEHRDLSLVVRAREMTIQAVTVAEPLATGQSSLEVSVATLRALLPTMATLSASENSLMDEWLARLARGRPAGSVA